MWICGACKVSKIKEVYIECERPKYCHAETERRIMAAEYLMEDR